MLSSSLSADIPPSGIPLMIEKSRDGEKLCLAASSERTEGDGTDDGPLPGLTGLRSSEFESSDVFSRSKMAGSTSARLEPFRDGGFEIEAVALFGFLVS